MKKKLICFLFMVMMVVLVSGNHLTTYAYEVLGYKWSSSTIRFYYENFNSARAKKYFVIGANGWSSTNVNFTSGNSANYNIYCNEINYENVAWDGLTNSKYSGKYFTRQTIQINQAQKKTWDSDGALQSVVIHEFGHGVGLDECSGAVIMNPYTWGENSRYGTYKITTIQTDDKKGANAIY